MSCSSFVLACLIHVPIRPYDRQSCRLPARPVAKQSTSSVLDRFLYCFRKANFRKLRLKLRSRVSFRNVDFPSVAPKSIVLCRLRLADRVHLQDSEVVRMKETWLVSSKIL